VGEAPPSASVPPLPGAQEGRAARSATRRLKTADQAMLDVIVGRDALAVQRPGPTE